MSAFDVTYSRVNEREAMTGGTTRHGFESQGESLRDAIDGIEFVHIGARA